jgi:two-component system OmpR family response regulator
MLSSAVKLDKNDDTHDDTHVVVADPQSAARSVLRRGFERAGHRVIEASDLDELLQLVREGPRITLITLELRDESYLKVAKQIRAERNIPLIMITERASPIDRLTGLQHGADDYIVKPFDIREVVLRSEAVLRRHDLEHRLLAVAAIGQREPIHDETSESYSFYGGRLHVVRRKVTLSHAEVTITDAEFDILVLFLRHPHRVLSRDEIMIKLKGRPCAPTERTVDGHIARLRKKLEPVSKSPRLIKTVWRLGYLYAGDVKRLH